MLILHNPLDLGEGAGFLDVKGRDPLAELLPRLDHCDGASEVKEIGTKIRRRKGVLILRFGVQANGSLLRRMGALASC